VLGQGTTFEIDHPATDRSPVVEDEGTDVTLPGGTEALLLIDDEPLVRGALRGLFELGGYRVIEASDGLEGLATFERERGSIDAVILDRMMPGLTGEEVLARLRALDPDLPVILLSGHPGQKREEGGASAVLMKPTSADTLLSTLREVLDRRAAADRAPVGSPVPSA
jgi:DNA-binding response OmpR family regulator